MKEIWYGFDKNGCAVETFFGTYGEAVDYFNSEKANSQVDHFNTKNDCEQIDDNFSELEDYMNNIRPFLESIE